MAGPGCVEGAASRTLPKSGALGKKPGLVVASTKEGGRGRVYRLGNANGGLFVP